MTQYASASDPALARYIDQLITVDGHGHPLVTGSEEVDLCHPINPYDHSLGLRMRPTNREYIGAWRALWGYQHDDLDADHLRALIETKMSAQTRPDYYDWVFDRLRSQAMIYIGAAPEPRFLSPRFHWCPHVEWMLWPFPKPDTQNKILVPAFLDANRRECQAGGWETVPQTLDKYVGALVDERLATFRDLGAVGIKFNTADYRPLRFDNVPAADATAIYRLAYARKPITSSQHTALQDFLFRAIVSRAGSLGLPVQVHTGLGAQPRFEIANSDPLLLESVFRDVPGTNFVLLHAGWPYDRQAVSALAHENVYLDFSCANLYFYPQSLARIIRSGLEWFPEKVLYGSDTHSDRSIAKLSGVPPRPNPLAGWEEKSWIIARASKEAVTIALAGMRDDGEITGQEVESLATAVLRGNTIELYRLDDLTEPIEQERRTP